MSVFLKMMKNMIPLGLGWCAWHWFRYGNPLHEWQGVLFATLLVALIEGLYLIRNQKR